MSAHFDKAVEAAWRNFLPRYQENEGHMPPMNEWLPPLLEAARPHLIAEVVELLRDECSLPNAASFIEQRFLTPGNSRRGGNSEPPNLHPSGGDASSVGFSRRRTDLPPDVRRSTYTADREPGLHVEALRQEPDDA